MGPSTRPSMEREKEREKGPVAEAVAKGGRGQGEEERLEGCLEPAVPLIIGVIP